MVSSKIILRLLPLWVATCCCTVLGEGIPIAHAQETADDGFVTSPSVSARRPLHLGSASMSEVPKMRASAKNKRLNADLSDFVTEYEDLNVDMKSLGSSQHPDRDAKFIPLQAREQVTDPKQVVSETKFTNLIIGEHLATEFRDPTNYNYAGASRNLSVMTDEMQHHRRAKEGKALKAKAGKAHKAKKSKSSKSAEIEYSDSRTFFELMDEYEELYNARLETQRVSPQRRLERDLDTQQKRLNKLEQDTYGLVRRRLDVSNAARTAAPDPGCDQDAACSRIVGAINLVQGVVGVFLNIAGCVFNGEEENCKSDWFAQGLILARAGVTILSFFFGEWAIFSVAVVELVAVVVDIWRALKDSQTPVVTLTNKEMLAEIFKRSKSIEEKITEKTRELKNRLDLSSLEAWLIKITIFNSMFSSESVEDITFDINDVVERFFDHVSKDGLDLSRSFNDAQNDIERVFHWFTKPDDDYARNLFFLNQTMFNATCKDGPCGRGAVDSLVKKDYDQVRTCLKDNEVVLRTIPIFFQGLSRVKEFASAHNNLLVQAKLAVENIRTITTFAEDVRLLRLDDMVTCRSGTILDIIELLEERKQMHDSTCMTLDEILDDNDKQNKTEPFDFGITREFNMWNYTNKHNIGLRLAQNTLSFNDTAGALVQTCTKNGRCNFPYLLGRCNDERIDASGNGAVTISGSQNIHSLRRDTCDVEDNTKSWETVFWNDAPDGSGFWQDCLVTFEAKSGREPPTTEAGCNCNTVVDKCKRCSWFCDGSTLLEKPAYVYALPEYCMLSQLTDPNRTEVTREEKCHSEMRNDDKWKLKPKLCR